MSYTFTVQKILDVIGVRYDNYTDVLTDELSPREGTQFVYSMVHQMSLRSLYASPTSLISRWADYAYRSTGSMDVYEEIFSGMILITREEYAALREAVGE